MEGTAMPSVAPPWARLLFLTLACTAVAGPSVAQETKAILVLHGYGYDAPARLPMDAALARALQSAPDVAVDLYFETIDPSRFRGAAQAEATRTYLRQRYADKNIAVIVAIYDRALGFLLDANDSLFPGVPIAALLSRYAQSLPHRVSAIWVGDTFADSAAVALKLHPGTRRIAVVDAAVEGAGGEEVYLEVMTQLEGIATSVSITPLRNLPLDELLPRVQALPSDTVILLVRQLIGRQGVPISSAAAVREIAAVASVPVYVSADVQIGSGAVGGVVSSLEGTAAEVAALALKIARERSLRLPPQESLPVPTFDWRALQRLGVNESLLPVGSRILFREPNIWERYRGYIVTSIAVIGVQTAFMVALVIQRVRRRRVELALRESEQHFRMMADTAPVLIWRSGIDLACDFFNKPWLDFRGRSLEQEQGAGWTSGVHPEDLERCGPTYRAMAPPAPFQTEYRLRRADGVYRWVLDVGVPRYDHDGHFAGYIGSALDITDRKEIEQSFRASEAALRESYEQNRDLVGRLIHAQEEERTRIARDLHDDVSQQLAGVAITLSGLKRQVDVPGAPPDLAPTVGDLQERTAALAQAIRTLSHELHPSVLEHAGLVPTLKRHCAEVQEHHRVEVIFDVMDTLLEGLPPDVTLCLFRVAQEALTNAVRHARARTIIVSLRATSMDVTLGVSDDGVGFATGERRGHGLGLRSIDERVRLINGQVTVRSHHGHGTELLVQVPWSPIRDGVHESC